MTLFGLGKAHSTHHTNFKYSFTSKGIQKTRIFKSKSYKLFESQWLYTT